MQFVISAVDHLNEFASECTQIDGKLHDHCGLSDGRPLASMIRPIDIPRHIT
jgi:hypothetical protein